jgi:histone arginine demethylase JMJD6
VLFPPHVPKSVVKGRKLILPGEDDEAIHYFTTILPRIKRSAAASGGKGDYSNFECYEFTQYPGETVFVPHGWWHAVLNITHTVGVTQNYCSKRNFDEVWLQTRSGRKKMACSWLRKLQEHYPDLARRAKALNRRDRFVMWEDDPEAQRRYRKKKADKERKKREKRERKEKEKAARKKEKWGDHRTTERRKEIES